MILCTHSFPLQDEDTISYRLVEEFGKKFGISGAGDPVMPSMQHGKNLQHAVTICVKKGEEVFQIPEGNRQQGYCSGRTSISH